MRYIATVSISLLLATIGSALAESRSSMGDPVFGMTYDPRNVHFENAPARVSRLCRDLRGDRFWLYAYFKAGDTEYFVLSNRSSEVSGVGVVLGTKCTVGLPDWVLSGDAKYQSFEADKQFVFTPPILHGLSSDLLRRYATAFGDKKTFLQAVKKGGLPPNDLVPVLRSEFEKFAKD